MTAEMWLCPDCHSINRAKTRRCYSCGSAWAPGASSTATGSPDARGQQGQAQSSHHGVDITSLRIAIPITVAGGILAAFLLVGVVLPLLRPSGPTEGAVAGIVATPTATPTATPLPAPSNATAPTPQPSPTPAPTPEPTNGPYLGRLSGTYLLSYRVAEAALAAGLYDTQELLVMKPDCKTGACSSSVEVKNPRSGKVVATGQFKLTSSGYRLRLKTTGTDLCRRPDGQTVQAGVKVTTTMTLRAMTSPDRDDFWLVGPRTMKAKLTARGKSAGCHGGTYAVAIGTQQMSKTDLASVTSFLSPQPLPDLVGVPTTKVKVKGATTMTYYPVKGTRASVLNDRWQAASSKSSRCGKITYTWYRGSGETLSCVKTTYSPTYSYDVNYFTGSCVITGVNLHPRYVVPIARWAGPSLVPRELVPWWKEMQRVVAKHEAGHIAIFQRYMGTLRSRIVGAACADGQRIINRWSKQVNAAQEAYDKVQYATQVFPTPPATAW